MEVLIPPKSVTVEPNETATMTCAIKGSYIPLKNPWRDSEGPLKAPDVTMSRIPPDATSGVVVWIVQFNHVSNRLGTNYTFQMTGIEPPLEASILPKNPPAGESIETFMHVLVPCVISVYCDFFQYLAALAWPN